MARWRVGSGNLIASDARELAKLIADQLIHQTAQAILETVFADDYADFWPIVGRGGAGRLTAPCAYRVPGTGRPKCGGECGYGGIGRISPCLLPGGGRNAQLSHDPAGPCRRCECDWRDPLVKSMCDTAVRSPHCPMANSGFIWIRGATGLWRYDDGHHMPTRCLNKIRIRCCGTGLVLKTSHCA